MHTASAFSVRPDTESAVREASRSLKDKLGEIPKIVLVYSTEHLATGALAATLQAEFPGVQIMGGTSCGGVMTEAGFHSAPSGALGLFGIVDRDGDYGVGYAPIASDPVAAGAAAVESALRAAGRDFETPTLVWCCQPPGHEESILEGIQTVIGYGTAIIGGSSADEEIAGQWRQFAGDQTLEDHVVVTVLFPSSRHGAAFQSGYARSEYSGMVTRASGRQILEIDHQPAAAVYSGWTRGAVPAAAEGMILAQSTPTPLGRIAGEAQGVPMFVLSHPALIGQDGSLSLFTDIEEGERVHLMQGSPVSLIKRAGLVVADACALGGWKGSESLGGLVIYCGGCMLYVRDAMDAVVEEIRAAMPGTPFLGAFTFGEQGAIVDNCNRHGNLMVSALSFG